jgi:chromosome segregation ATPase
MGRWGRRDPEELEERDWRRRLLLASRKIQGVQMAISADAADVRGLKAKLSSTRPAVERLNEELGAARAATQTLSAQLARHLEYLQAHPAGTVAPAEIARIQALEAELERTREALRQAAQARVAPDAPRAPIAPPTPPHERSLHSDLASARQRVVDLELQVRGLEADRVELSQTRGLMQRVQEEALQRVAFLEGRLRSAEELRIQSEVGHERREHELRQLLAAGEARIRELEASLAEAAGNGSPELEEGLRAELEGRIEELTRLVAEFEASRQDARRQHGHELAEQTARLLELESFCQDLGKARDELQLERDRAASELAELRAKLEVVVGEKSELEERLRRLLAEADAAREAERKDIEAERETLRVQGEERAKQHAEEMLDLSTSHERVLERVRSKLRETEMARVELETRHQRELIDFADHSRERIRALEGTLRERELAHHSLEDARKQIEEALRATQVIMEQKGHEAEDLQRRLAEAEEKNARLQLALQELESLQTDVMSSGQRLGERTTRLLDIMRTGHGQERAPTTPTPT